MLLLGRAKHQKGEMTKCLPFYNVKAHCTRICCSQLDLSVIQIQFPLASILQGGIDHLTSHFWCIKVTWKTRESIFIDNTEYQIAFKEEKRTARKPNCLRWHPVSSSVVSLAFSEYLHYLGSNICYDFNIKIYVQCTKGETLVFKHAYRLKEK